MNKILIIQLIIIYSLLVACENIIEYSPYQVKTNHLKNDKNIKIIQHLCSDSLEFLPFKIALIGDTHTYYDDFDDMVTVLNKLDSVDFIVHLGDITLSGINREFLWYCNIIDRLRIPIITIVGNHDFLANGYQMYIELFGKSNFSFEYNNCNLVFFDNIIWERNGADPNFEWLYKQTEPDSVKKYTHQFVFAHIPPWDESFSIGNEYLYNIMMESNNVSLSIHGHTHSFLYDKYYDNTPYLVIGDASDREIVVLSVLHDSILVNKITF
ncbi:MAG: metallophosphoesterase [Marinilabiliaceae bacterium]|nr:metallophosphoesterase [Marinilabiliaceae bacterium]